MTNKEKHRGQSACGAALVVVLAVCASQCLAQTPEPVPPGVAPPGPRPHLDPFPAEQEWSFLAARDQRSDPYDRLKYLPFGKTADRYLSLGLEYRIEYEYYNNWMDGAGVQDHDGYVLTRVMPHVDAHLASDLRFFGEMTFNYLSGRNGGPRANLDEDRGDFHQGFFELGRQGAASNGAHLRLGRQEIVLGSGRLFDNNEGPNVKLSFDGARFFTQTAVLRWDVFAAKPVQNKTGFFDDKPDHAQTTWGTYLTLHPGPQQATGADVYYLGLATAHAAYAVGSASEVRHTLGTRIFREPENGLRFNWEANYQLGTFGSRHIAAWSVATESGYTFASTRFSPRPLLRVDAYSGDGANARQALGTYNAYFPRGAYFTPKAIPFVGNQNLVDLHPQMQFHLRQNLTGEIGANAYWRRSVHDAVYAFGSGAVFMNAGSSRSRFLGTQGDMELRWAPVAHVVVALNAARFSPQGFLAQAPRHRPPITTNSGITYRF